MMICAIYQNFSSEITHTVENPICIKIIKYDSVPFVFLRISPWLCNHCTALNYGISYANLSELFTLLHSSHCAQHHTLNWNIFYTLMLSSLIDFNKNWLKLQRQIIQCIVINRHVQWLSRFDDDFESQRDSLDTRSRFRQHSIFFNDWHIYHQ